jgi:hypothetical protein
VSTLAEPSLLHRPRDDSERLHLWRLQYGLELGFTVKEATSIADSRRDLHALEDEIKSLLERGCTPETARKIAL